MKDLDMDNVIGGGPQGEWANEADTQEDWKWDAYKEVTGNDIRAPLTAAERDYICEGVTRSMSAVNRIALEMPEGQISQQMLLVGLLKAYHAGRESK